MYIFQYGSERYFNILFFMSPQRCCLYNTLSVVALSRVCPLTIILSIHMPSIYRNTLAMILLPHLLHLITSCLVRAKFAQTFLIEM